MVGGAVRDHLLGVVSTDVDIEVFGLSEAQVWALLQSFGAHHVGRAFPVYKCQLGGLAVDISLPRREQHRSHRHHDVAVSVDPMMSFSEAASRRDFTINAMGIVWSTGQLLDPFGGESDLLHGCLRHVGPAFVEDPLRVFRAARFAARFSHQVVPETVHICHRMPLLALSKERVWEELTRLLLGPNPGDGLRWYARLGCLVWFPELDALRGVPQDPFYHPEGDAWQHTCLVVSAMNALGIPTEHRLVLYLAALCHDLGKSVTTSWQQGRWRALGHETVGAEMTARMLLRLGCGHQVRQAVSDLVRCHMRPLQLYVSHQRHTVSDTAIRRLSCAVSMKKLLWLATADHNGDGGVFECDPVHVRWLRLRAEVLSVLHCPMSPLVKGQDLVDWGYVPGPQLGLLLKRLFAAQIQGRFDSKEGARLFLKRM